MGKKKRIKKSIHKVDGRIVAACILILLIVFLSVFGLPLFREGKLSSVTGKISNVSIERSSFGKAKRKVLFFDLDHVSYYFPLTNVVKQEQMDSLLQSLLACEQSQSPVSVEVTEERDYRDLLVSSGRVHAISLSFDTQRVPLDAYRKEVSFLRAVLLLFAFVLTIPLVFLSYLSRKEAAHG